jgi:hypothetical protein
MGVKFAILPWRKKTDRRCLRRVLWKICGAVREKVKGGWRKLHAEELHNLYSSQILYCSGDQIEENEMGWAHSPHERDAK